MCNPRPLLCNSVKGCSFYFYHYFLQTYFMFNVYLRTISAKACMVVKIAVGFWLVYFGLTFIFALVGHD